MQELIAAELLEHAFDAGRYVVYGSRRGSETWHVLLVHRGPGTDRELLVTGETHVDARSNILEKGPPRVRAVSMGFPLEPDAWNAIKAAILAWQ